MSTCRPLFDTAVTAAALHCCSSHLAWTAEVASSVCLRAGRISGRGDKRGKKCLLLRDSNRRLSFLHSILRTRFFSRKIQSCQIRPVSFLLVWLFATSSNGDAFLPVDARRPLFARAPGRAHIALALAHLPCFNTAAFSYCCVVCRPLSWVFRPVLSV